MAVAGAGMVLLGFFLPWVEGTSEFAARDFSGFDLARLVRNFEVVASSPSEAGRDRLTAMALYLAPALAVNGALLALVQAIRREAAAAASGAGAAYALAVLSAVAALSAVPGTDLRGVLGAPMPGFYVSAAGAVALAASAVLTWRRR
jgi:hypothetical protein